MNLRKRLLPAVVAVLALVEVANLFAPDVVAQATQTFTAFVTGAPSAGTLTGSEPVPCIQGGVTKKCTASQLSGASASISLSGDCTGASSGGVIPTNCPALGHLASTQAWSNNNNFSGVGTGRRVVNSSTQLCASLGAGCAPSGSGATFWPGIDNIVCGDPGGGAIVLTLPPGTGTAIGNGYAFNLSIDDCRNHATATNTITIAANTGQTVCGAATQIINAAGRLALNLGWNPQDNDWNCF